MYREYSWKIDWFLLVIKSHYDFIKFGLIFQHEGFPNYMKKNLQIVSRTALNYTQGKKYLCLFWWSDTSNHDNYHFALSIKENLITHSGAPTYLMTPHESFLIPMQYVYI